MSRLVMNTAVRTKEKFDFSYRTTARKVCREALRQAGFPADAEVELTVTGPEEIHELNRTYRGIDRETDVLSFPNLSYESAGDFAFLQEAGADWMDPDTGCVFLGAIVINAARVREQAASYGHSELREYAFLVAHSMLHLFGYDHETPEEAAAMEEGQERILRALGIGREKVAHEP
ncbi:MAG: rRNA maturation RNase YbeY [Eubacteriales bacterium]|nr:rRNA maturation RNase YbeY [Eubacteriales bacterium]